MPLRNSSEDRFFDSFDTNTSDETIIRTSVEGTLVPSGLQTAGATTKVTVTDAAWVALPATALVGRTGILVQNQGESSIWVNTSAAPAADEGLLLGKLGTFQTDIAAAIAIYAKCQSGSVDVIVMEFA